MRRYLSGLSMVQTETVALGIGHEKGTTDLSVHDFGDGDIFRHGLIAHRGEVVHFECSAELRTGHDAEAFAVSDAKRGVADIELGPLIAEHLARLEADHVAIKRLSARNVAYGIRDKC